MNPTSTQAAQESTAAPSSAPKPRVFDRSQKFDISVPHPDFPNGEKTARVTYPTDAQWCDRARQLVTISKSLGRDATKSEVPKRLEINKGLFERIRVLPDVMSAAHPTLAEFDEAEATRVIERLERCTVTEVLKQGVNYQITMRTFNGRNVVHTLRIPTQRQMMDLGRSAVQMTARRQSTEMRVMLEPSAELWGKLVVNYSGYPEPQTPAAVPIIHMDAAISELLLQVNNELESDMDGAEGED